MATIVFIFAPISKDTRAASATDSLGPDVVTIQGKECKGFDGKPISSLRLYAMGPKGFVPVPLQVDERKPNGEWAFQEGKLKADDDGKLDSNDEIAFMARDMGAQTGKDKWPDGVTLAAELEVTRPNTGKKAYGYLFAFDNPPAAPTKDYVNYDSKKNIGRGETYKLGFTNPKLPMSYDYIIATQFGTADIFDRLKIRLIADAKLGNIRVERTEEHFNVNFFGSIDGPVRVIRKQKNNVTLVWKIPAPGSMITTVYYSDYIIWPVPINLPFDPKTLLKKAELQILRDFALDPKAGNIFYNNLHPEGFLIDGKMSEAEKKINGESIVWQGIRGPQGYFLERLVMPENTPLKAVDFYVDDVNPVLKPEYIPGSIPVFGFRINGFMELKPGEYLLMFYQYYPGKSFTPGNEQIWMDMIDHPLKVSIKRID